METPEFTIDRASPPKDGRGSGPHPKSSLRLQVESLQPGERLRWRTPEGKARSTVYATVWQVKREFKERRYTVRKENHGHDIYRLA
jgi:hypothetical protein